MVREDVVLETTLVLIELVVDLVSLQGAEAFLNKLTQMAGILPRTLLLLLVQPVKYVGESDIQPLNVVISLITPIKVIIFLRL